MNLPKFAVAAISAAVVFPSIAADWPQYAGPNQNRTTPEKVQRFAASGPKEIWKTQAPGGFSSCAVSGDKAFTMTMRNVEGADRETLVALDANTGKELWFAPIGPIKINDGGQSGTADNQGGDGPRCTPTVDGNRVYVNSYKLVLSCFDAASGKEIWSHDIVKEFAGRNIGWGNAASALVDGDLVFAAGGGAGQSLIAFDKATGKVAWKKHDEKMTHATPVAATILGQRQIIFFTQSGLVSVNPKDGALLWKHPFRYSVSTAISPVVADDIVYCAAGYGVGAMAARISKQGDGFKATQLWLTTGNKPVANHWSTPVYHDGYLYGMFSFKEYGNGPMKCVDIKTGQVKWEKPGFGAGQVILAGNTILALSDKGELVEVEPTPTAYKELARAKVVAGKCWSTPTVANGRIFVRSTKEAACFDAGSSVVSN
jgi:outer membrane protein assembly factor BamB